MTCHQFLQLIEAALEQDPSLGDECDIINVEDQTEDVLRLGGKEPQLRVQLQSGEVFLLAIREGHRD